MKKQIAFVLIVATLALCINYVYEVFPLHRPQISAAHTYEERNERNYTFWCNKNDDKVTSKMVLSYALFGDGTRWNSNKGEKYQECLRKLAKERQEVELYKDWVIRVYHDNSNFAQKVTLEHAGDPYVRFCNIHQLTQFENLRDIMGMFWRAIPLSDPTVDVVCSRDLDSALTTREEAAVIEWLASNKSLHTMRDNPYHSIGMLGGMWCFRNELHRKVSKTMLLEILTIAKTVRSRDDQPTLNRVIWNRMKKDCMQHDSYTCMNFPGSRPFPTQHNESGRFVGCANHVCAGKLPECPEQCRPNNHKSWLYC